jgi:hypothetical protein
MLASIKAEAATRIVPVLALSNDAAIFRKKKLFMNMIYLFSAIPELTLDRGFYK